MSEDDKQKILTGIENIGSGRTVPFPNEISFWGASSDSPEGKLVAELVGSFGERGASDGLDSGVIVDGLDSGVIVWLERNPHLIYSLFEIRDEIRRIYGNNGLRLSTTGMCAYTIVVTIVINSNQSEDFLSKKSERFWFEFWADHVVTYGGRINVVCCWDER